MHPDKTCFADRVNYHIASNGKDHVAFVVGLYPDDPHKADLIFWCRTRSGWFEARGVQFGKADNRDYYVNPEA